MMTAHGFVPFRSPSVIQESWNFIGHTITLTLAVTLAVNLGTGYEDRPGQVVGFWGSMAVGLGIALAIWVGTVGIVWWRRRHHAAGGC